MAESGSFPQLTMCWAKGSRAFTTTASVPQTFIPRQKPRKPEAIRLTDRLLFLLEEFSIV